MLVPRPNKSNSQAESFKSSFSNHKAARLFAVRDPDILHLAGMLQEPASFGQFRIEPVDGPAFVGPDLFQSADRHGFRGSGAGFVSKGPDGIDIVVLSESFQELRRVAGHDVYCASGQIAGVKELIKIGGDERVSF